MCYLLTDLSRASFFNKKVIFKFFLIFFILSTSTSRIICQNYWEIYGGISHSNIMNISFNQQVTLNHTLNAPFWTYGYQTGINRSWNINQRFCLTTGIRIQLKGDKNSVHQVLPIDTIQSRRFLYGMIPINLKFKILSTKNIFLKAGLSGNYLLSMGDIEDPALAMWESIDKFSEKIGLSGQLGFNFDLIPHLSAELMYSQDLTNIIKIPVEGIPNVDLTYRNQAFEFTLIYRL